MTSDDIKEIQAACKSLTEEIGPHSQVTACIGARRVSANAYFKSGKWSGDDFQIVEAETPLEAIEKLRARWLAQMSDRQAAAIKEAALGIIEITHSQGECTDAALRGFMKNRLTDEIIASAVLMANEMADSGPFSVIAIRGANAA